jgi:hypothetical protein
MGYNSNCYYTTCARKCCNYAGTCPEDYSSSYYSTDYTECYYYYDNYYNNSTSGGGIAGIVIGCIVGVVLLIALIIYCKRKRAGEQQLAQQAAMGNTSGNQTIVLTNQPGQPYGQPVYGQPVYGGPPAPPMYNQPYVQPPAYGNQYPQQQGPIIITS